MNFFVSVAVRFLSTKFGSHRIKTIRNQLCKKICILSRFRQIYFIAIQFKLTYVYVFFLLLFYRYRHPTAIFGMFYHWKECKIWKSFPARFIRSFKARTYRNHDIAREKNSENVKLLIWLNGKALSFWDHCLDGAYVQPKNCKRKMDLI